jgi:hypothetical protein
VDWGGTTAKSQLSYLSCGGGGEVQVPRPHRHPVLLVGFGRVLRGGALRLLHACGGPAEGGAGGVDEDAWHGALVAGVFVGPGVGGDGADDQDSIPLAQAVGDVLTEGAEGCAAVPGRLAVGPFAGVGVLAPTVDQNWEPDDLFPAGGVVTSMSAAMLPSNVIVVCNMSAAPFLWVVAVCRPGGPCALPG